MDGSYGSGGTNRFTRLSKTISALLLLGCGVAFFVPSTTAYLTLVPGRLAICPSIRCNDRVRCMNDRPLCITGRYHVCGISLQQASSPTTQ